MQDVKDALIASGRPEVLDELKTVFLETITVSAIEAKYSAAQKGEATADERRSDLRPDDDSERSMLQYAQLRGTCLAMLRVTGRDDLSEVFGALWESNDEREDEGASLYTLMDRIIDRSVTLRDVRDLIGGKIG